jgi:putative lipase involved disintegration of autophagic bodies
LVDLQVIKAAMETYRTEHKQYPPRVVTTGHSLGGALATIAAAHIAIKYPQYRLMLMQCLLTIHSGRCKATRLQGPVWVMMHCTAAMFRSWAMLQCKYRI